MLRESESVVYSSIKQNLAMLPTFCHVFCCLTSNRVTADAIQSLQEAGIKPQ
jgi:hypothetical protein